MKAIRNLNDFKNFVQTQLDRLQKNVKFYVQVQQWHYEYDMSITIGLYEKNNDEVVFIHYKDVNDLIYQYERKGTNLKNFCYMFEAGINAILDKRKFEINL